MSTGVGLPVMATSKGGGALEVRSNGSGIVPEVGLSIDAGIDGDWDA